jgi:hypothetical protein
MNRTTRNVLAVVLAVVGLGLVLGFAQAFTVAVIVAESDVIKTADTVAQGFSECESRRDALRLKGFDCEPCELWCPSSVTGGSFSYNPQSTLYSGTYSGLSCDVTGRTALLEVKSFCNNDIVVCERQVGSGSLLSQSSIPNGVIREVKYAFEPYNCDTGQVLPGVPIYKTSFFLVCDSGYFSQGRTSDVDRNRLGSCVSPQVDQDTAAVLSGSLTQVVAPSRIASGDTITIRGTFVPNVDGTYLAYAQVIPRASNQALALVRESSATDVCGGEKNAAGAFLSLKSGDTGLFDLRIVAPSQTGEYDVVVTIQSSCTSGAMADRVLRLSVEGRQSIEQQVISEVVTENPELAREVLSELEFKVAQIMALDACDDTTDFLVDGCPIGACEAGQVVLYSEDEINAACADSELSETLQLITANTTRASASLSSARWLAVGLGVLVLVIAGALMFRSADKPKKKRGAKK